MVALQEVTRVIPFSGASKSPGGGEGGWVIKKQQAKVHVFFTLRIWQGCSCSIKGRGDLTTWVAPAMS
jgi:hypothetical protein